MRRTAVPVAMALAMTLVSAQTPQAPPDSGGRTFEVASIKRNTSTGSGRSVGSRAGGRFVMVNGPVATLVRSAYPSDTSELIGAPDWIQSERYDVNAKAEGNPARDEMQAMLRALLADRFKLAMHYETREQPVYALMLSRSDGRLGAEIRRSALDCEAVAAANRIGRPLDVPLPANGAPACGMSAGGGTLRIGGMPLRSLAGSIAGATGRVIVDKTGLEGNYEVTLRYATQPAALTAPNAAGVNDPPSIFTALREQLGLKLEPDRAPLQMIVIDHIERPTED
jgi:uncharacterized protein (TIGR03435 family)